MRRERLQGLRRVVVTALASLALLSASPAFALTDEERAGARSLAKAGEEAFREGRYDEAIDLYARAESVVHSPVHLLFMGRAQVKVGKLVQARESFLKIKREQLRPGAPEFFKTVQADAIAALQSLEPRLPYLTIEVEGAGSEPVKVTMDEAEVPAAFVGVAGPVNPGKHVVQAVSGAMASEAVTVDVQEGKREIVALTLVARVDESAAPPPAVAAPSAAPAPVDTGADDGGGSGLRIGSYAALGVGAVGVGLGTVFALQHGSKRGDADSLNDECRPRGCTLDERDEIKGFDNDANSAGTLSIVAFAVGAAGIGTGITLLVLSGKSSDEQARPSVAPYAGLGSVGVRGRF